MSEYLIKAKMTRYSYIYLYKDIYSVVSWLDRIKNKYLIISYSTESRDMQLNLGSAIRLKSEATTVYTSFDE